VTRRADERRGEGVWLLVFLALLAIGAKPASGVADHPPTHTTRGAGSAATPTPSSAARADIPAGYLALYRAAAKTCPGLPWGVLAGIGKVETNHGRSRAPGVVSGVNAFGCCAGPMQFNVRNGPPSTWDRYGRGGNVYDPADAIPAAARLLCANGARGDLRQAIYAYNHAWWYVAQVLAHARAYQAGGER
jgi:membrane-bound lytic murein transglycosylase B